MLAVDEAQDKILSLSELLPTETVELADAVDRVLATDAASDIDSPPYDKALMDGFAIDSRSFEGSGTRLQVTQTVTAGEIPRHALATGQAVRIMTGAMLPKGADAVVMFEQTRVEGDEVVLETGEVRAEQNLLRRATVMRDGEIVLRRGRRLGPMDVGLLGEIGYDPVEVFRRAELAVLATGNELVPTGEKPPAGSIRNSNGPMLASYARACGATPLALGIARDEPADLSQRIERGLAADVLVLSGGVSAGDLDLIPQILREQQVEQVFHGVHLKPGKPLWAGIRRANDGGRPTVVLGLPGNPVSSLVCFHLFAAPLLRKMSGEATVKPDRFVGVLQHDWTHRGGRPTYYPALARAGEQSIEVNLCPWKGSADQRSLGDANALVVLPPHAHGFQRGEAVSFEWLR